jgi:hypothetical protein
VWLGRAFEQLAPHPATQWLMHPDYQPRRLGRGGIKKVAASVGVDPETVSRGVREVAAGPVADGRVRAAGRASAGDRDRAGGERGVRVSGGAGHPRRSGVAVAVDEQVHAEAG